MSKNESFLFIQNYNSRSGRKQQHFSFKTAISLEFNGFLLFTCNNVNIITHNFLKNEITENPHKSMV